MRSHQAAVDWAAGGPWNEALADVPEDVRYFLISFSESAKSDEQRLVELSPRISAILDASHKDEHAKERGYLILDWLVRTYAVAWLRLIPSLRTHAEALVNLAAMGRIREVETAGRVVRNARSATKALAEVSIIEAEDWVAGWDAAWFIAGETTARNAPTSTLGAAAGAAAQHAVLTAAMVAAMLSAASSVKVDATVVELRASVLTLLDCMLAVG